MITVCSISFEITVLKNSFIEISIFSAIDDEPFKNIFHNIYIRP